MPEYPDVEVYVRRLRTHVVDCVIEEARIASPFVVRTYDPPMSEVPGKRILTVECLGKRIVFGLEDDLHLVIRRPIEVETARRQTRAPPGPGCLRLR